jgi:hypothetical protein
MNKTILWAIIGVIVIGGLIFYMNSSDNDMEMEENEETEEGAFSGSFRQLLASQTSQECTFQDAEGNGGTVAVANGNMRGDFTSTINGEMTNSHMIVRDNTVYTWADGMTTGFQLSLDATAEADAEAGESVDLDREVDYECHPESVDASRFDLPEGITFTDVSAVLEGSAEGELELNQCGACEAIADPAARQQCLQALGC